MKLPTTGGSPLAVFLVFLVLVAWATPSPVNGQDVRARDLGVSLGILPPGPLNDVNGFHVQREQVFEALEAATGGPVPEGNVGEGTGMVCFNFKGGIGTDSRELPERWGGWTVGVLVQCNYGWKRLLRIDGVPVGRQIERPTTCVAMPRGRWPKRLLKSGGVRAQGDPWMPCSEHREEGSSSPGEGSGAGTGDADRPLAEGYGERSDRDSIIAVVGTAEAAEEAVVNALVAAETMEGADRIRVRELPHDRLREILAEHGRAGVGNE